MLGINRFAWKGGGGLKSAVGNFTMSILMSLNYPPEPILIQWKTLHSCTTGTTINNVFIVPWSQETHEQEYLNWYNYYLNNVMHVRVKGMPNEIHFYMN